MNKYRQIPTLLICFTMLLSSCNVNKNEINNQNTETYDEEENKTVMLSEENTNDSRMNPYIFYKSEPIDTIKKEINAHSYKGDTGHWNYLYIKNI